MIDQPQGDKSALTVVIQSWWTPALSVIFLVVGLLAGYFGRPLIKKDAAANGPVAVVTTPTTTSPISQVTGPTQAVDPTLDAITTADQAMKYLIGKATHFEGDPNATVTMIEFSDYQ